MSLKFEHLETPAKALYRKLPPEKTLGYATRWMMEKEVNVWEDEGENNSKKLQP